MQLGHVSQVQRQFRKEFQTNYPMLSIIAIDSSCTCSKCSYAVFKKNAVS